ncbi:MAG: hypothetical protein SPD47_06855 [Oscillospiraceae bacterium]|nr:hypothetical protein [Oscillospiraceae bacterium]
MGVILQRPSFVDDGVPDSMTVDVQRIAFSTGEERGYGRSSTGSGSE